MQLTRTGVVQLTSRNAQKLNAHVVPKTSPPQVFGTNWQDAGLPSGTLPGDHEPRRLARGKWAPLHERIPEVVGLRRIYRGAMIQRSSFTERQRSPEVWKSESGAKAYTCLQALSISRLYIYSCAIIVHMSVHMLSLFVGRDRKISYRGCGGAAIWPNAGGLTRESMQTSQAGRPWSRERHPASASRPQRSWRALARLYSSSGAIETRPNKSQRASPSRQAALPSG